MSITKTDVELRSKKFYKEIVIDGILFLTEGYEGKFLLELEKYKISAKNLCENQIIQYFDKDGKSRKWYPDFIDLSNNHVYEIKSQWTLSQWKNKEERIKAIEELGYRLTIIAYYDKKDNNPQVYEYGPL